MLEHRQYADIPVPTSTFCSRHRVAACNRLVEWHSSQRLHGSCTRTLLSPIMMFFPSSLHRSALCSGNRHQLVKLSLKPFQLIEQPAQSLNSLVGLPFAPTIHANAAGGTHICTLPSESMLSVLAACSYFLSRATLPWFLHLGKIRSLGHMGWCQWGILARKRWA